MRSLLLATGWILAIAGLYAGVAGLEVYWNITDWRPAYDSIAAFLLAWCAAMLMAIGWLARRRDQGRIALMASIILGVLLAALSIHTLPAEPVSIGLFGRTQSSPFWYRGSRAIVLLAPLALGLWGWRSRRSRAGAPVQNGQDVHRP